MTMMIIIIHIDWCQNKKLFHISQLELIQNQNLVINTLISTVFALSIVLSQLLINVNPRFWYFDPILSIVLAFFMAGFGLKVIHENFNILKPTCVSQNYNNNLASFNDYSYQVHTPTMIQIDDLAKRSQHFAKNMGYGTRG